MCRWVRKRFVTPSLVCLFAGLAIFIYRGPGWVFLRFYVGDVVAVAFLYFTLSLFWGAPAAIRASVIATIAGSIELAQLLALTPKDGSLVTEIVFGSNFDAWDLLAYAIGLLVAVATDWWLMSDFGN